MKIAQIAPLYEAVPPRLYGGTERVVAHLVDALIDDGHEVTLFASGDSVTRASLQAARTTALRLDPAPLKSDLAAHLALLHEVRRQAHRFDVLHFHTDMLHFPFFEELAPRTVTTLHGRLDITDLAGTYARWPSYALVSISGHQRALLPEANWAATIAHGLSPDTYLWSAAAEPGYLAFLGRISPEKRPDRAIEIAKAAGIMLRIAAKVDPADREYFRREIQPRLDDPLIEFVGEIGDADKIAFLRGARALLFPIDWPEPFGLVMIEAMACGTPVIAWRCGASSEVVDEGVTGFVVDDMPSAIAATRSVGTLCRRRVRERFEARFTARTMARSYVRLYEQLTSQSRRARDIEEPA
jgi:glycosyltransferase involved in cell wall biosynthesis